MNCIGPLTIWLGESEKNNFKFFLTDFSSLYQQQISIKLNICNMFTRYGYSTINEQTKSQAKTNFIELIVLVCLVVFIGMQALPVISKKKIQTSQKIYVRLLGEIEIKLNERRILPKISKSNIIKSIPQNDVINLSGQSIPALGYKRATLGQPVIRNQQLNIFVIQSASYNDHSHCSIVNGLKTVTKITVDSVQQLLNNNVSSRILFFINKNDLSAIQLLQSRFKNYVFKKSLANLDSDYQFVKKYIKNCQKISYIFPHFIIDKKMAQVIREEKLALKPLSLYYTSSALVKNCLQSLTHLNQVDLHEIPVHQFSSYIYIFDASFLQIITPLSFGYYSKYTIEEAIIIPILSIVQESKNIFTSPKILHRFYESFQSAQQFKVHQPKQQNNSICFISYPNNPFHISKDDFQSYLRGINSNLEANNNISLIIYLPYKYGASRPLYSLSIKMLQFQQKNNLKFSRVKFRIMGKKAVSSHAVYDAVYGYCPNQTLVTSSRHNVVFNENFTKQVLGSVTEKFHFYHINYKKNNGEVIFFDKIPLAHLFLVRRSNLFQTYFKHFQIFKSDFLKTNLFWVLKNAQLDFYETQSPFTILMLQQVKLIFHYINKTLAHVKDRNQTQLQKQQILNVKKYVQYHPLIDNKLMPYPFSCLQNRAYKRFAPQKMQRIIHQIWIGKQKISNIRMRLHRTVVDKHPNFTIKLWRFENITKTNFPITYNLAQRIFQYHKTSQKSYFTLAADLLRYEVIYQHGGLYIDFKMQSLKPMNGFLKYQILFLDCDISSLRYLSPKVIGVGIIGGMRNSYYFNSLLNQFIYQANIDFQKMIPLMSGSYVARRAFNDQQFFTILNLGFQLVYPLPYETLINACGGEGKKFDDDQQTYTIVDYQTKKNINIGIPCKEYPQAYLVSYTPLAKTWLFQKRNVS